MKLKAFGFVLALQTLWLFGMVALQESYLAHGKLIFLETQLVDPRDMLRGDYLILNYKISNVPANLFLTPPKKEFPLGMNIFVALAPGTNEFYQITRASTDKFTPAIGEILLRAQTAYAWWDRTNAVHVTYGIENYFVAEGTGNPNGNLTVQAIVSASGRAKIKQVFLDGKPYAEAIKK